jgi:hypothetical protein
LSSVWRGERSIADALPPAGGVGTLLRRWRGRVLEAGAERLAGVQERSLQTRAATGLGAWRGRIEHRTARPLMPSVGHSRDDRSRCRSTLDVLHHVEVMQRPLAIGSLLGVVGVPVGLRCSPPADGRSEHSRPAGLGARTRPGFQRNDALSNPVLGLANSAGSHTPWSIGTSSCLASSSRRLIHALLHRVHTDLTVSDAGSRR